MIKDEEILDDPEAGTEDENDVKGQNIIDYSKAVVWGTDWTAETIINQLDKNNIELNPDFQRRDAWDIIKKSKLIESLILGLPVPPIILAERRDKKNSYIVIDGKQRLMTIMQFCAKEGSTKYDKLYLKGLEVLKELNSYNYSKLDELQLSVDYKSQFDNQVIRTVVIKNWPDEKFLYTVFLRLNTGSLKLSPQELRQALHPGKFLKYVNDYTLKDNPIQRILKINKPDPRMRDVELLIRYFAFRFFKDDYNGNLKEFFDNAAKVLNERWITEEFEIMSTITDLEDSLNLVTEIFSEVNRFSKFIKGKYTKIFNRTIYDIVLYGFKDKNTRIKARSKKKEIVDLFENLMSSNKQFIHSLEGSTKDLDRTTARFSIWLNELNNLL